MNCYGQRLKILREISLTVLIVNLQIDSQNNNNDNNNNNNNNDKIK